MVTHFIPYDNDGRKEEANMKESVGKRLSELRKKKGWTQEELAKKLNVSAQAVSKWEKDVSLPDVGLLGSIASTFETSIDYLLGHQQGQVVGISTPAQKKDLNKLVFKIKVLSSDGDKVNVNLPWPLVKVALDMGVTPKVDGKDVLKDIDINKVMALVEQGVIGKIVEIESKDGDFVEIVVE
jgi:transcriptional regulator with XRE-family HTH domain